jgi:hypothetical protein
VEETRTISRKGQSTPSLFFSAETDMQGIFVGDETIKLKEIKKK